MHPGMKRSAAVAAATIGALSIGFHAVHPPSDALSPSAEGRSAASQYKEVEQTRARELRRQGNLLQDATNQDALRAAEHRPPPADAERDAERLLVRALEKEVP